MSDDVSANCLNCGMALAGPYCAQCGQHAVSPRPNLHELIHDAIEEFLHLDGKIVQTLRKLIAYPGGLTCDVLAGRRARYITPLRLYLTCSLVYFLLATLAPLKMVVSYRPTNRSGFTRVASQPLSAEDREKLLARVPQQPRLLQPLTRRLIEDPNGLGRDVFAAWPKALFVLLPVFAVIVALFFRRRHFVEHVYFALHLHAFAFLVLCATALVSFAHSRLASLVVGVGVLLWIPIYAHLAFRRVYASTHVITALKEIGVVVLYGIASVPAIVIAAIWVASHPH
jgi:uncharacterized protein DUF3667